MKPSGKKSPVKKLQLAALSLLAAFALAGCATSPPPPLKGNPGLLGFLSDDKTTRMEAIATLGEPSGQFEHERILTYRLGFEPQNKGYYLVGRETTPSGWPVWTATDFSLVLVFDDAGILRKHSLIRVNK